MAWSIAGTSSPNHTMCVEVGINRIYHGSSYLQTIPQYPDHCRTARFESSPCRCKNVCRTRTLVQIICVMTWTSWVRSSAAMQWCAVLGFILQLCPAFVVKSGPAHCLHASPLVRQLPWRHGPPTNRRISKGKYHFLHLLPPDRITIFFIVPFSALNHHRTTTIRLEKR
jgi:hypothetical protein